jgi:site-specific recombinase XerD
MIRISFYQYLSKKNNSGDAPIYMVIKGLGSKISISLNVFENPKHWDCKKCRFKSGYLKSSFLNNLITEKENEVWKIVTSIKKSGKELTRSVLKKYLQNRNESDKERTILQAFDHFINQNRILYSKGTIRHYEADRRLLSNFISTRFKQSDIIITEIGYDFFTAYESHLFQIRKNKPNTIAKHLIRIRAILNHAIRIDWLLDNPAKKFKIKSVSTARIVLNVDEVNALSKLDLEGIHNLEIARDLFVFMAQTGLSYADLRELNRSHVENNYGLIRITRKKSKENCIIPILPKAKEVLKKYEKHPVSIYRDKFFPVPCNQVFNRNLKRIADMAKINKKITCHIARHTFACIALDKKVPMESISAVLGHQNIRTTQIYAKVSSGKIETDFKALNNVFG